MTPKAEKVFAYVRKFSDENGILQISVRSMAKIIHEKEQGLFNSWENCRRYIGHYLNQTHPNYKQSVSVVPKQVSSIKEGMEKRNLWTKETPRKDVKLKPGNWLILSDIHIPEHDSEAIMAACEYGLKHGVTGIILNGDVVDMYGVSSFLRETQRMSIREEIAMTREFFAFLRETFGDIPIVYKFGNHEERMRHFILRNAREIEDIDGMKLEEQLHLKKYNIIPVGREIIWAGKLAILHGHEMARTFAPPVNPARGAFLRAKSSLLIGHHHQTSEHMEGNLKGDTFVTYSTGCLCTLSPEYNPYGYTKWNLGFARVEVEANRNYTVYNHRIINGKVY